MCSRQKVIRVTNDGTIITLLLIFLQQLKPSEVDSEQIPLECRLRQGKWPFVQYKEEVLNRSPFITLIHNVMTDTEARVMKLEAFHKVRHDVLMLKEGFARSHALFFYQNNQIRHEFLPDGACSCGG